LVSRHGFWRRVQKRVVEEDSGERFGIAGEACCEVEAMIIMLQTVKSMGGHQ
jgi:hypothetical protein